MSDIIHSDVTGKDYHPKDVVRILNQRQVCCYMQFGVQPVDIYPSIDFKTNNPVLVVLFNREETRDVYDRWCRSENLWEELQNGGTKNE